MPGERRSFSGGWFDAGLFAILQTFTPSRVVSQPRFDVIIIETSPVEEVTEQVDLLLPSGEDIAVDDAIQLRIVEMIGAFENDALIVQSLDGDPEDFG